MYKVRLIYIVIRGSLTCQRYVDEVLHTHIMQIYQTVGIFFSSSKTISAYLQYDKELFANWSCHTPLTGLLRPDSSPISHPWDILGRRIYDRISSQLPHFPKSNTSWMNNCNVFHEGWGTTPGFF